MNRELSDFAARLREMIPVGDDVRSLWPSNGENEPPHVGSYDHSFNSLALELFELQFKLNAAYRRSCETRRLTPGVVKHWTQIPAVPTAAFKELELSCILPEERTVVFHSSGTTDQKPSRHYHNRESLELYESSLWSWFTRHVVPECGILILTPPPAEAPHSSLVHMFETIRQKLGEASVPASRSPFFGKVENGGVWTLDFDAVVAAFKSAIGNRQSAILLGTAFSFVHLLDYLAERGLQVELPAGSRVMETGGYKNRSRTLPKAELHALITERLGVPPENIVCEYGMSELSSQAYAVTSDKWQVTRNGDLSCHPSPVTRHFRFPPWARAQIVSPETGHEVADGETGLIRIYDLANVFSVMAVQTEDLAIRRGDGFELLGRAPVAEARGCSLMSTDISPQRRKGAEKKLDNSKLSVSASLR